MSRKPVTVHVSPSTGPRDAVAAPCTNDADTTAEIRFSGRKTGTVFNPSGSAVRIDYYSARASGGTAGAHDDVDGVAASQLVKAGGSAELPWAIAGLPLVIPVVDTAAVTLYFHFN